MIFLGRRQQPMIGIDISSTSVKLIELSRSGNRFKVESYAAEPLPTNAIVEKNIVDANAVTESLRKAIKRSGTKTTRCALAVPSSAAISKVVAIPAAQSELELEAQIQLEADQYIPYALDEVNLDFEVLGPHAGNPAMIDVLLAASRKENVEKRTAIAEAAGLSPVVMDVESYATCNAYSLINTQVRTTEHPVVAIIDIGHTMTSITVVQDGQLVFSREQAFGGRQLTEEIMRRYGLSYAEAGLAKKEGGLPDNHGPEILKKFKDNMAQQAHRLLQFFFAASQHTEVSEIVLAGGCASIPGADEVIEVRTHTRTTIANPFNRMNFSPKINQQRLGNDAAALLVTVGLALRGFD